MKIGDHLDALQALERERLLGRIEGMQLAQRIARNRSADAPTEQGRQEALNCAGAIRMMQVMVGNGSLPFGDLSAAEQDAIWRIY